MYVRIASFLKTFARLLCGLYLLYFHKNDSMGRLRLARLTTLMMQ